MDVSPPPKRLKNQLVHLDHNLKQIERTRYAGIQRADNALPVLEAFQLFLDGERRRMTRRLTIVTGTLLLLVAVGAGVAVTAVVLLAGNVEREQADATARLRALSGSIAESTQASGQALERLRTELAGAREALATDQAAWGSSQSNMASVVDGYASSMDTLQALVAELQAKNARLASSVDAMETRWPELSNVVATVRSELAAAQAATAVAPVVGSARGATEAVTGPAIGLAIVPEGQVHPIRWRLPSIAARE